MIKLSFSSLNQLHEASHQWLNRQYGIQVPDYHFFKEGKIAHNVIQKHVSGEEKCDDLKHIKDEFPIVERRDFDPACKITMFVKPNGEEVEFFSKKEDKLITIATNDPIRDEYEITGYVDGRTEDWKKLMEAKSSGTPWSLGRFQKSQQRKIYHLATGCEEQILITCTRDLELWKDKKPKIFSLKPTPQDATEAALWIAQGIQILEAGDFTGGLDENGKCTGCLYGNNCYYL